MPASPTRSMLKAFDIALLVDKYRPRYLGSKPCRADHQSDYLFIHNECNSIRFRHLPHLVTLSRSRQQPLTSEYLCNMPNVAPSPTPQTLLLNIAIHFSRVFVVHPGSSSSRVRYLVWYESSIWCRCPVSDNVQV